MLKSFFLLCTLIAIACGGSCIAQPAALKDPSAAGIQKYRQAFWDTLFTPHAWVNDRASIFTPEQKHQLDSTITAFEQATSAEIAVVTLDTFCVARQDFDKMAKRIARRWGIGKKGKNNGMLICICPGYRKMRIANGKGIIPFMSDFTTQRFINEQFFPSYKAGDYFGGTKRGLQAIIQKLKEREVQ